MTTSLLDTKVELLPIDSILWEDRQRTNYSPESIEKLADSIAAVGLNTPILVSGSTNRLVAGGRRIKAHELLGRTHIQAVRKDNLSDWELVAIELFENIHREDLSYVDEVAAKEKFHQIYLTKMGHKKTLGGGPGRPNWRLEDTAKLLNITAANLSTDLELAKALHTNPDLADFKNKSQAMSALRRKQETIVRQVLATASAAATKQTPPIEDSTSQDSTPKIPQFTDKGVTIYNAPFSDVISLIPDNSISLILTDPPWQVQYDETFGTDVSIGLDLTKEFLKLIKPKLTSTAQGWLFCATKHLIKGTIYNLISNEGYYVHDQILIWYKPHVGASSHPYNELKNDYEPAVWFSVSPTCSISTPTWAVQPHIVGTKFHPAQKPLLLLTHLIDLCTVSGELIIDPFCGSGVVGLSASQLGRRAILVDKDPNHYNTSINLLTSKLKFSESSHDSKS
jgi:DNA modification methylase